MAAPGRSGIRVDLRGSGAASVETGLPVIDRLLERLAEYARFDLALEVEPGAAEVEVAEAGSALGRALARPCPGGGDPRPRLAPRSPPRRPRRPPGSSS